MLRYILRRVLIFIPTLFAISIIAFIISINAPGDPIDVLVQGGNQGSDAGNVMNRNLEQRKDSIRRKLGLDLPVFYFSFSNIAVPDTLYRIFDQNEHEAASRLINIYGNWDEISAWMKSVKAMQHSLDNIAPDSIAQQRLGRDSANQLLDITRQDMMSLLATYDEVVISSRLKKISAGEQALVSLGEHNFLGAAQKPIEQSRAAFDAMRSHATKWKNYVPSIKCYGYNQYQRWLFGDGNWLTGKNAVNTKGVIRGDFGKTYTSMLSEPVSKTISRALPWSLFFTVTSVLFAYLVSIPIGVQAAANRGGFFDRTSSVVLFMLFSLPSFFMATLLLMTFANPDVLNIFEAGGVEPAAGIPHGISLWAKLKIELPFLVLPFICYTYSSLAFLSRTMRVALLEILNQDYMRTARAKGLSKFNVIYRHGLRNALLPIITVFANIFPAAVGGSVILEFIFTIPGMGKEIIEAIYTKDYPMIVCVFTLTGVMTLLGYLISDILYAVADPRISYSKNSKG
ncbi:MAG TPA: ABC transporter permease [Bacteroidia bacterium]|nr:ABC transporter permease [Bacteroidia bacterium]